MSNDALLSLAKSANLAPDWIDAAGTPRMVREETLIAVLKALGLPAHSPRAIADSERAIAARRQRPPAMLVVRAGEALPLSAGRRAIVHLAGGEVRPLDVANPGSKDAHALAPHEIGYHRIEIDGQIGDLAIAPQSCHTVGTLAPGRRLAGVAVQLYALRGGHTEGFGDLAALTAFARQAAPLGIDAVAVSPMHALLPGEISPYSPSTRHFYNPLYADSALAGGRCAIDDDGALVDWPQASERKMAMLRNAFETFPVRSDGDFAQFRAQGGERLVREALFDGLAHHFWRQGVSNPLSWPAAYRDPASREVAAFARERKDELTFQMFLQWLATESVRAAQSAALEAGMAVGIIADLAVGMSPAGSHAWSAPHELLCGVHIGAPPDLFNPVGQDWGLTALSPASFREHGYGAFIATLRAAMRDAGGVRIDHAMGLQRLWLVPEGAPPTDGVYLHYPARDFLRLIALESRLNSAIVIGEDLGTVPEGFREALAESGILGMEVLWFQRDGRGFLAPERWSRHSAALTTTHDLPTVAGWWKGHDIDWLNRLNRKSKHDGIAAERLAREEDRHTLWSALTAARAAGGPQPAATDAEPVVEGACAFVGGTPCDLAIVPIEDIAGLSEQPNIPGTVGEHPNWRRRLPPGNILDLPLAQRNLGALRRTRKPA